MLPDKITWDFMGTLCTYRAFGDQISKCADALAHIGLKKGDTITISMPTTPQGIICFYAANKIGAVASMIHPLSTETEICVIGVPDMDQVERVKAFVVLKPGISPGPDREKELIAHCQKELIKWSCPRNIEFRETLPLTLVGKVAYKVLQDQEIETLREQGDYTGDK